MYLFREEIDSLAMGRYYTCEVCGIEGKGCLECNCGQTADNKTVALMNTCQILKSQFVYEYVDKYLVMHLQDKDGLSHFVKVILQSYEYSPRSLREISMDDYFALVNAMPDGGD